MTGKGEKNKEEVFDYLLKIENDMLECDDCLSKRLNIIPRQQINAIANKLKKAGKVNRYNKECHTCLKNKLVTEIK